MQSDQDRKPGVWVPLTQAQQLGPRDSSGGCQPGGLGEHAGRAGAGPLTGGRAYLKDVSSLSVTQQL